MTWKEYLTERRMKSDRTIMFHGTSSKFLKSIMNKGLKAEPTKKVWKDDPNANIDMPSRASLRGAYLSSDYGIASSSALRSQQKFGGNRLIICALIQQRSALPDEDDVKNYIRNGFQYVLEKSHGQRILENETSIVRLYVYIKQNPKELKEFAEVFRKGVLEYDKTLNKKSIPIEKAKKMLMATIERKLVYIDAENTFGGWSGFKYDVPEIFKGRPTNKGEAERNYSKATDDFSKSIKSIAVQKGYSWGHTLRVTEDIKFKGRNKIVSIIEISESEDGQRNWLKIHYGKPPKEFEKKYKKLTGLPIMYV